MWPLSCNNSLGVWAPPGRYPLFLAWTASWSLCYNVSFTFTDTPGPPRREYNTTIDCLALVAFWSLIMSFPDLISLVYCIPTKPTPYGRRQVQRTAWYAAWAPRPTGAVPLCAFMAKFGQHLKLVTLQKSDTLQALFAQALYFLVINFPMSLHCYTLGGGGECLTPKASFLSSQCEV